MATSGKIRLMLALLCASLLLTAVIVRQTYTPVNNLDQTAKILEGNLQQKEAYVNSFINDKASYNKLKDLQDSPHTSIDLIKDFTADRNIWFITLKNNQLDFWSGIKVIPELPATIKEGYSFHKESNGYYEVIRKSEGNFSAIFFIPVKISYTFQNPYLQNTFAPDLTKDNNIEIADFTDKSVYEIRSTNNTYLFSVKIKQGEVSHTFFYYEITIWLLTLLCFCILVNNVCNYIATKGYVIVSVITLAAFIVLVRWINLYFNWPEFTYRLEVFNPTLYASSFAYRSLGDLCINILAICWFVSFLYLRRRSILKGTHSKVSAYAILVTGTLTLIIVSAGLLNVFYGLVMNSKISFDVSNVLNLSPFSLLGVLMLCFSFLIFYLLSEVFLTITVRLPVSSLNKAAILIAGVVLATIISAYYQGFTMFYLLWAGLVFTRAYAHRYNSGKITAISMAMIILICALISAIKLNYFESVKENVTRTAFIQKLEVPDDANADIAFKRVEHQIINDASIKQYFTDSVQNTNYVKTRFQKLYFNGYLSKYDFNVHEFNDKDQPLSADKSYSLTIFKDLVLYSSFKVSDFFYRVNESFGYQNYFAILPIVKNGQNLGTIVIELKSKPLQTFTSFPDLLVDGQVNLEDEFKNYSYAFYIDNKLITQSGPYVYDLENTELQGKLKKYIEKTTLSTRSEWYLHFTNYSHLIYKPSQRNLIVVSKEQNLLFIGITSITFFFVVFLLFSVLILILSWLWIRIKILNIKNNRIGWSFKLNFDLILYKTRIQFSMIFAVVATLVAVGFITFFSISTQYQTQQDKTIREKITRIASALEASNYNKYLYDINEESQVEFNEFANTYAADLTLYDVNGMELINTQPKIYEFGLQARRMNARAYVYLKKFQKSEFVNDEIIGKLNYKAVYVPLRNGNGTIAYLQLPYFANEADYKERIGALLNIMINVYALIFIAIGLFAVIIARQITAPLSFIQFSLSKTTYGKKNEPIHWDRNDEIGALVKEYNKMIAALENSAQKLAQSERETAWREMAKQVAHEIKNPLTPLKLGLQLLDKSWKDKDPKFDQKFERFSKSFVEQIESLSNIASEFSAFAKMPDTKLEKLNLFDVLTQAVTIFKQMDNVRIVYQAPNSPFIINADRDQLLRCFNNLLKNAIEAAPADRFGVIDINYTITNKNVLLTIKDNGNGIPENLREKIFEPNFTTKSSGTGLGLAFVKNSIENAGGKVWFETRLGEGTTFYFSLPSALV
ncbi:GHKL domain-containing protein [Mucilaginibacter sp. BJC16-A38]|uniref:ATP-binding protein n=1 Tax=Mucilaginibacter phenanthrenivorans TaxID=1234842 RepID=UPI0021572A9B|nr:ATP-binding protein [Mucilaginibacter phenanthrenivorans]MCR8559427.1 GHKL domain-containing protein [Mucilaginibacter phenanthrenivorans]